MHNNYNPGALGWERVVGSIRSMTQHQHFRLLSRFLTNLVLRLSTRAPSSAFRRLISPSHHPTTSSHPFLCILFHFYTPRKGNLHLSLHGIINTTVERERSNFQKVAGLHRRGQIVGHIRFTVFPLLLDDIAQAGTFCSFGFTFLAGL